MYLDIYSSTSKVCLQDEKLHSLEAFAAGKTSIRRAKVQTSLINSFCAAKGGGVGGGGQEKLYGSHRPVL